MLPHYVTSPSLLLPPTYEAHAPPRVASLARRLLRWPPRPQDRRHRHPPLRPLQQGRRRIRPHRCPYRRRRLLRPAQSLHLLCRRPRRPRMGSACRQGCMSFLPTLQPSTLSNPRCRRIPNRPCTLPTSSLQTTSSRQRGLSSLHSSGGYGLLTTAAARPIRRPSKP